MDNRAAANGCRIVNLSTGCPTLLPYERVGADKVEQYMTSRIGDDAREFVQPELLGAGGISI